MSQHNKAVQVDGGMRGDVGEPDTLESESVFIMMPVGAEVFDLEEMQKVLQLEQMGRIPENEVLLSPKPKRRTSHKYLDELPVVPAAPRRKPSLSIPMTQVVLGQNEPKSPPARLARSPLRQRSPLAPNRAKRFMMKKPELPFAAKALPAGAAAAPNVLAVENVPPLSPRSPRGAHALSHARLEAALPLPGLAVTSPTERVRSPLRSPAVALQPIQKEVQKLALGQNVEQAKSKSPEFDPAVRGENKASHASPSPSAEGRGAPSSVAGLPADAPPPPPSFSHNVVVSALDRLKPQRRLHRAEQPLPPPPAAFDPDSALEPAPEQPQRSVQRRFSRLERKIAQVTGDVLEKHAVNVDELRGQVSPTLLAYFQRPQTALGG